MSSNVRLQLLGPIEVKLNGAAVSGFESQKAKALLCYLAYGGHAVSRSKLAGLFWENKTELQALANLSRVLHNIQKILPGSLHKVYRSVEFANLDNCWVDTKVIESLEAKGDVDSLKNSVELFHGDFMEGIFLADCPQFDAWLTREQEHWRQKIAEIYSKLITIFTLQGNYSEGIHYCSRLLAIQPWREEAHRRLMVLLALSGSRLAALRQYEICEKILEEELNVPPSEETRLLYQKIRSSQTIRIIDPNLPLSIPVTGSYQNDLTEQLPVLDDTENDLGAILDRLQNPTCRMLTLLGSEQSEKRDHLALHSAAKASSSFRDGVFYHPLAATNQNESYIRAFIEKFIDHTASENIHGEMMLQFLRDKEMLLVLTNVVPSPPIVNLLEGILKRSPFVKILITASQSTGSHLEWIFDVLSGKNGKPAH